MDILCAMITKASDLNLLQQLVRRHINDRVSLYVDDVMFIMWLVTLA
jgi:hypothetical protein